MNKNAIKKFAIDARNKLIASVTDKAGMLGITPDNCSEAITKGADFEVYKTAAGTEVTLNKKQCEQRRKLVDQIHARGFEAVVEEVAYTWFNRICAIRFMEVNDYMYPVRAVSYTHLHGIHIRWSHCRKRHREDHCKVWQRRSSSHILRCKELRLCHTLQ